MCDKLVVGTLIW